MKKWIDFIALRENLDFRQVLEHYGVSIKRRGDQHYGRCPLPGHSETNKSDCFSAHLTRGIFQCFRCHQKGNVLEFAALMEGVNPSNGAELRTVAEKLTRAFSTRMPQTVEPPKTVDVSKIGVINQPLNFELKGLDVNHSYLATRGLIPRTINEFGLGVCVRGFLKDRLAIPLRDQMGRLIGYAGRLVNDAEISESRPQCLFPGDRLRNGVRHSFRKSLFLYNGWRFQAPVDHLIVVEGFASVWWLTQNSFPTVVATMGSDCSDRQRELILNSVKAAGRISILPDGDDAGQKYGDRLLGELARHRFVRLIGLEKGSQPTDLHPESIRRLIAP